MRLQDMFLFFKSSPTVCDAPIGTVITFKQPAKKLMPVFKCPNVEYMKSVRRMYRRHITPGTLHLPR